MIHAHGIELENRGWRMSGGGNLSRRLNPRKFAHIPVSEGHYRALATSNRTWWPMWDIAPQRKDDPGPRFPWRELAAQGDWRSASTPQRCVAFLYLADARRIRQSIATVLALLSRYGYEVKADMTAREQQRVIMAFQMHFRPAAMERIADAERRRLPKHYWKRRINAVNFP